MRKNEISNMRITFADTYTETGKPIGPILTLPVNPKASDDDVFFAGKTLGDLQKLDVHSIQRMDSCDLRGAEE